VDQESSTYLERGTTILEEERWQLHAKPHTYDRFLATSHLYCGKNRKNNLLLMKVSGRDQNVKVKMLVVASFIIITKNIRILLLLLYPLNGLFPGQPG